MAKRASKKDTATLAADPNASIPRIKLGSQGFTGLRVSNRQIYDEAIKAFQYPNFIHTVNEMRNNPTVGAAMNVYRMMMSRVKWYVEPPVGATPVEIERAKFIETCMHDMDKPWSTFIEEVIPYLEYGFDIHEKVLRRRLTKFGSKFNDGKVGIKTLAPRNQETITGWTFTQDGSELVEVEQDITRMEYAVAFQNRLNEHGRVPIPREKFLLFTASANRGNPQGNSIYKNIYLAFKELTLLQEQELIGIAKDIQGILKIEIPPKYLDQNASPDDQAVAKSFQEIIDRYNAGTQRGILVPNFVDPESKTPMFKYDLMESKGAAKYDVEKIISRLQNDILSALNVDILKMGAAGSGSFNLAENKSSILAVAIDYRLREVAEVLSTDLMRTLFEMNGWETTNLPKFQYADIEEISLQDFSSAVQRIFATSAIEVDRPVLNRVRKSLGIPELPDDLPVQEDKLPGNMIAQQSKSGDGMKSGAGDGTRKNAVAGQGNSSTSNKANK